MFCFCFSSQGESRPGNALDDLTKQTTSIVRTLATELEKVTEQQKKNLDELNKTFQASVSGLADKISDAVENLQSTYSARSGDVDEALKGMLGSITEAAKKVQNGELAQLEQIRTYRKVLEEFYSNVTDELKRTAETVGNEATGESGPVVMLWKLTRFLGAKEEVARQARSMVMRINDGAQAFGGQVQELLTRLAD